MDRPPAQGLYYIISTSRLVGAPVDRGAGAGGRSGVAEGGAVVDGIGTDRDHGNARDYEFARGREGSELTRWSFGTHGFTFL